MKPKSTESGSRRSVCTDHAARRKIISLRSVGRTDDERSRVATNAVRRTERDPGDYHATKTLGGRRPQTVLFCTDLRLSASRPAAHVGEQDASPSGVRPCLHCMQFTSPAELNRVELSTNCDEDAKERAVQLASKRSRWRRRR